MFTATATQVTMRRTPMRAAPTISAIMARRVRVFGVGGRGASEGPSGLDGGDIPLTRET